jgi:hypothetical protein
LENGIFANGFREKIDSIDSGHHEVDASLVAAKTFAEHSRQLALFTLREGRLGRTLEKALAALEAPQAERKARYEKAANQAKIFAKYAASRGKTYEPGDDFKPASAWGGFAFSEDDLLRRYHRQPLRRRPLPPPRRPRPATEAGKRPRNRHGSVIRPHDFEPFSTTRAQFPR